MERAGVAVGKVLVNVTRGDCLVRHPLNPSEESKVVKRCDVIVGAGEADELQSLTPQCLVSAFNKVPAHQNELIDKTVTEC